MNYYFIGTFEDCETYNSLVVEVVGLHGTTTRWADPIELEDGSWAIISNPNVESIMSRVETISPKYNG